MISFHLLINLEGKATEEMDDDRACRRILARREFAAVLIQSENYAHAAFDRCKYFMVMSY